MLLGRYQVTGQLGRGASGTVFRARTSEGGDFAIKVLSAPSPDARLRFERERRLLDELGEGFVPLLDAGEAPQGPFIVMPFVGGGTLRDRLRHGKLDFAEGRLLGIRLADALGRAHAKGIVHRDLKPENILYTRTGAATGDWGDPLIADLGLAKHFDRAASPQSQSLSVEGSFRGTAGYMSPEQTYDSRDVDARADVFSLACVLYEALAGQPAFLADTLPELFERLVAGRVEPLRDLCPGVPRELAAAIERALSPDPEARFADGAAFASALRSRSMPS